MLIKVHHFSFQHNTLCFQMFWYCCVPESPTLPLVLVRTSLWRPSSSMISVPTWSVSAAIWWDRAMLSDARFNDWAPWISRFRCEASNLWNEKNHHTKCINFNETNLYWFKCYLFNKLKTRSHATWTNAVADVYVNSVKRFLQTSQTFIFILLS